MLCWLWRTRVFGVGVGVGSSWVGCSRPCHRRERSAAVRVVVGAPMPSQGRTCLRCRHAHVSRRACGAVPCRRELNASNNIIDVLPAEIGRCRSLKKLKLSGNRLRVLPPELSFCRSLEVINASENVLESLPAELSTLPALAVLSLANNKLKSIPYSFADCHTLVDVDFSNNMALEMIPTEVRTNARVVLWICDKWRCTSSLRGGTVAVPCVLWVHWLDRLAARAFVTFVCAVGRVVLPCCAMCSTRLNAKGADRSERRAGGAGEDAG